MKSLSNFENPSSNPLQEDSSGFEVAVTLKVFPWFWKLFQRPDITCKLKKRDQWEHRKDRTEILMRLSKQSLELVSVFKAASGNFIFIFFFYKTSPHFFKPFAHVHKVLILFNRPSKHIFIWWPSPFNPSKILKIVRFPPTSSWRLLTTSLPIK